jgi:hypothetical protein
MFMPALPNAVSAPKNWNALIIVSYTRIGRALHLRKAYRDSGVASSWWDGYL